MGTDTLPLNGLGYGLPIVIELGRRSFDISNGSPLYPVSPGVVRHSII